MRYCDLPLPQVGLELELGPQHPELSLALLATLLKITNEDRD